MTFAHSNTTANRRAVGVFANRRAAEQALHQLRDSGFPMDRVSIVTRDANNHDNIAGAEVHDRSGNKADEGAATGALTGGALGGLAGLLVGLGTLAIPGIGPIMLAGATATTLATTLAGGAIGAVTGGLVGALVGLGIPEERAKVYNDRVAQGGYLVIVDGTEQEIAHAETILHRGGIEEYGVYHAPAAAASSVSTTPVSVNRTKQALGVFANRRDAELAVADLRQANFPLSQVSLVAQQLDRREAFTGVDLRDRLDSLLGSNQRSQVYHDRLTRGNYVVAIHGTEAEVRQAESVLRARNIQDWQIYETTNGQVLSDHANATQTSVTGSDRINPTGQVVNSDPQVVIVDRRSETH
ncbi:hypothetical protein IFO70_20195 [Phormidium tenue FACHB-886]|nr:hypothetical protein [Phormidium tenue FACHB-886]